MELLLRYTIDEPSVAYGGDCQTEYQRRHTVGDLLDALRELIERETGQPTEPQGLTLRLERTGMMLDGTLTIVDSGLINGDSVVLTALRRGAGLQVDDRPRTGANWGSLSGLAMTVLSGPDAGLYEVLKPGTYFMGRNSGSKVISLSDAKLNIRHAVLTVQPDYTVTITDCASRAGTMVGQTKAGIETKVNANDLVRLGDETVLSLVPVTEVERHTDMLGNIEFNRTPYQRVAIRTRKFEALPPFPVTPEKRRFSIPAILLPMAGGAFMAIAFKNVLFLGFMVLSPIMGVWQFIDDRRHGKKSLHDKIVSYNERVVRYLTQLDSALDEEKSERLRAAPSPGELIKRALFRQIRLWERGPHEIDFLRLRLGLGELPSRVEAGVERGGDEERREDVAERVTRRSHIHEVPITIDLLSGAFGCFGDRQHVVEVGANLLMQVAVLHSPEEVVIAAALGEHEREVFDWMKWLPHARSASSPLEGDHLVVGNADARDLLLRLLDVASQRRDLPREALPIPHVVLVLSEAVGIDRPLLSRLLDVAVAAGISLVWMGETEDALPRQCTMILNSGDGKTGLLRFTAPELQPIAVDLERIGTSERNSVGLFLSPVRDATAASATSAIPSYVELNDLLGVQQLTPAFVADMWQRADDVALNAVIGQSVGGTIGIDLVSDGPHALVAGTSGAGKSEFLQTLVASLAIAYSPLRLNFLFIDYKGGAAVQDFEPLPHAVGFVTNLDQRLSLRALTSLRAELQRRMLLLEGRAKDLQQLRASGAEDAPPSLVIVIDEFATLVKEIPEFVAGIVDIAQRGRSLGIHLVLATQRPSGAVNDNILANTNLRVSLRVVDGADSNSIIGSPDAAHIPAPLRGRAFLRTGPGELRPFQAAYSSAPLADPDDAHADMLTMQPFTVGQRLLSTARAKARREDGTTQLHALVAAAKTASAQEGHGPTRKPWLEPLPNLITLADCQLRREDGVQALISASPGRYVTLGISDDPENQSQSESVLDLESAGGMFIFGTGGAGKTTALRTIAMAACRQAGPDAVQIAAFDFAGRSLEALTALPHCYGVSAGDDPERVTRMLTLLTAEIVRRRDLLAAAQVATFSELAAAGKATSIPRILVFIDSYGTFQTTFDRLDNGDWLDTMRDLVTQGRQVGIHSIITADRRNAVPAALFSAVGTRMVLRGADPDEMVSVGVPSKIARTIELVDGRGLLGGTREVQVGCITTDPSGTAQTAEIQAFGQLLHRSGARGAPPLPELFAQMQPVGPPAEPMLSNFAVADLSLRPVHCDLRQDNFLVAGPAETGRTTALRAIAEGLRASTPNARLFCVGGNDERTDQEAFWDDCYFGRRNHAVFLERVADEAEGIAHDDEAPPMFLFIDLADDIDSPEAGAAIDRIMAVDHCRLVVASSSAMAARYHPGWFGHIVRSKRWLFLHPEPFGDADQVSSLRLRARPGQPFPPGRGFFVTDRAYQLVQVATTEPTN